MSFPAMYVYVCSLDTSWQLCFIVYPHNRLA